MLKYFCLSLALLVAPSLTLAQSGILLAVTEVDAARGEATYWWTEPAQPRWTRSDQAMRGMFEALQLSVLDPALVPAASELSKRVYDRPHLSHTNAVQLAGLLGASRVLVGTVELVPGEALALLGETSVTARFDLHLLSTQSTIELLAFQLEQTAFDGDPEVARQRALDGGLERMRTMLERAGGLAETQIGVQTEEPVLVITGLRRGKPLVAIKRQLKSRGDIQDAMELWAAEGVIAVEINPGEIDSPERVSSAVEELLMFPFEGFRVQLIRREAGRFEIAVVPRGGEEPSLTP